MGGDDGLVPVGGLRGVCGLPGGSLGLEWRRAGRGAFKSAAQR